MKNKFSILILILPLLLLSSCNKTPSRQAFIGIEAATDGVNSIADAYELKLLTQAQIIQLQPYTRAVTSATTSLNRAMLTKAVDLKEYRNALNEAVISLLNAKAEAIHNKQIPSTQP